MASTTEEVVARISKQHVIIEGKPGKTDRKVSHADFITGLQNASINEANDVEEDSVAMKTPLILPPNVYLLGKGKASMQIGMYYRGRVIPEVKFDVGGTINTYKNVAFPNMIFSVVLRNTTDPRDKSIKYKFSSWKAFATDRHVLSLPTQMITRSDTRSHIWTLPLPNVFDDARICTGGNSIFTTFTHDLRTLGYLYRMILDSPFNSDLSVPHLRGDYRPRDWLRDVLAGKEVFPYEMLSGFSSDLHTKHMEEFASNENR